MQLVANEKIEQRPWTFENELKFISSLGSHSDIVNGHRCTRRQLLEGYAVGLRQRNDGLFDNGQMLALRQRVAMELLHERI